MVFLVTAAGRVTIGVIRVVVFQAFVCISAARTNGAPDERTVPPTD